MTHNRVSFKNDLQFSGMDVLTSFNKYVPMPNCGDNIMLGTEHTKMKKHYLCLQKTSNHEQWQALWHSDLRRYTPDWNPTRLEGLSPGCFTSDPATCECV